MTIAVTSTGEASTCHTELRKTKRARKNVVPIVMFADGEKSSKKWWSSVLFHKMLQKLVRTALSGREQLSEYLQTFQKFYVINLLYNK
jgi:hypothetical protein